MKNEHVSGRCPMAGAQAVVPRLIRYIQTKLEKKYPGQRPLRTFHTKTIGLVKAEIDVEPNLADRLKVGLFKTCRTYPAWIRFSNSSSTLGADIKKAARGMAIKVLDVEGSGFLDPDPDGRTQDIILFTGRTYFPGTAALQPDAVKTVLGNWLEMAAGFLKVVFTTRKGLLAFLKVSAVSANVLEEMYYSATPYAFGEGKRIKWHVKPGKTITSLVPDRPKNDYLRNRLVQDLAPDAPEDISFGLYIQFGENDHTEPIDDAAVRWTTPFHRVATIRIPRQHFATPQRHQKDNTITFSPGHAIVEHTPLGSVNEVRRAVYRQLGRERLSYPPAAE